MYTGFIREIDGVGRIVIPMQLRKELGLTATGSRVEMFSDGKQIILKKSESDCIFCKAETELTEFEGKFICKSETDLVEFEGNHVCKACLEKLKAAEFTE